MDAIWGPRKARESRPPGHSRGDLQARACWRWSNFLSSLPSGGERVLRINLDETSLKMHISPRPGLVVEPCPKRRRQLLREGQGPSLGMRRAAATLIAFICDDDAVQARLPQIIVASKHLVNAVDFAEVAGQCEGNVLMVRRDSAWVTASFVVEVVKVVARCIEAELTSRRVILHLDACPAHASPKVIKACSAVGLHVHFVPALTTAWLQPLDVLVFARLKSWAGREIEEQRVASATGLLTKPQVLEIYRRAVSAILHQGGWAKAFDLCGLRGQQGLSKRLMARLQFAEYPVVDSSVPSLSDLVATFPTGAAIPIDELFELAVAAPRPPPLAVLRLPSAARLPKLVVRLHRD